METSAKTAMNVNEIFMAIGKFSTIPSWENEMGMHHYVSLLQKCSFIVPPPPTSKLAKKLPKNEPQGGAGAGGRARGGVDLQEAAPQGRSGHCCGGGN